MLSSLQVFFFTVFLCNFFFSHESRKSRGGVVFKDYAECILNQVGNFFIDQIGHLSQYITHNLLYHQFIQMLPIGGEEKIATLADYQMTGK